MECKTNIYSHWEYDECRCVLGINSCPIEGFDKKAVEEILGLDTSKYQLSMVLLFGYRLNEQPKHFRLPFEEVVEFIK